MERLQKFISGLRDIRDVISPPPSFETIYVGANPAQLRESGIPDSLFHGYAFSVDTGTGIFCKVSMWSCARWGPFHSMGPVVMIEQEVDEVSENTNAPLDLKEKFVSNVSTIRKLLPDSCRSWADQDALSLTVRISLDPCGLHDGFLLGQKEVADLVERFPSKGLQPQGVYVVYYSNMTERMLKGSSLPPGGWQRPKIK